jgi:serine/threonine protein phosphatase PrpC
MLHVANLGDSRAVIGTMVNNKIHAEQLTRDHRINVQAITEELLVMSIDGSLRVIKVFFVFL